MLCKDRQGNTVFGENSQDNFLKLLYGNVIGRSFLRLITKPIVSRVIGNILSTKASCLLINPFIKSNGLDMSDYYERSYCSYNDFFTRELISDARPINQAKNVLITPADGRISVYKIDEDSVFSIKNSYYTVESMLNSKKYAKKYHGGYCVITRLCVDNFHRYCYPDNGIQGKTKFINGVLHTVNPEALNHYNIYKENCRECTLLHTENFGDIMQIEVGALMVGKIKNHHSCGKVFNKGDEKGMFEFGGSTVVMLIEKDKVRIDADLIQNSNEGFETYVKMGECIGKSVL